MITVDYARTMARYNRWINASIYGFAGRLSDAERKRDLGAFFKSLHGTLNHILVGDRVWMGRFLGRPVSFPSLAHEICSDFGELGRERAKTDDAIEAYAAALTPERLEQAARLPHRPRSKERRLPARLRAHPFLQPPDPSPRPGDDSVDAARHRSGLDRSHRPPRRGAARVMARGCSRSRPSFEARQEARTSG